jgi:hypothetical protein
MYAATGRWGGNLTSRPLPLDDPSLDGLSDEVRAELAATWLGRVATERRVADAFQVIHDALVALGAAPELVTLARRAIDDEYRHTELSRVVASAYAGRQLEEPPRLELRVPSLDGAPEELRHVLHVFGHCAVNETTASAFLEVCVRYATGSLARSACRELLSDEIDHARLGWGFLESVPRRLLMQMGPWLLPIVRANVRVWRETRRGHADDEVLAGHGAPPSDALDSSLLVAVKDLIVPGLARLGLPTGPIAKWLEAGAPSR